MIITRRGRAAGLREALGEISDVIEQCRRQQSLPGLSDEAAARRAFAASVLLQAALRIEERARALEGKKRRERT